MLAHCKQGRCVRVPSGLSVHPSGRWCGRTSRMNLVEGGPAADYHRRHPHRALSMSRSRRWLSRLRRSNRLTRTATGRRSCQGTRDASPKRAPLRLQLLRRTTSLTRGLRSTATPASRRARGPLGSGRRRVVGIMLAAPAIRQALSTRCNPRSRRRSASASCPATRAPSTSTASSTSPSGD
jgi:hypothetical protein